MTNRCIECGRFVALDAIEVVNPAYANPQDPDGWTDTYICDRCYQRENPTATGVVESVMFSILHRNIGLLVLSPS